MRTRTRDPRPEPADAGRTRDNPQRHALAPEPPTFPEEKIGLMVSPLRRAVRVVVALLLLISMTVPAMSADAPQQPKIVSVSISGNAHVPTDRILSVVKAKVGDAFDPKVVQDDLQNIFALGYFADQVPPLIDQRPDGIAITYRVIENPVITAIRFDGNAHVPSDTLLALMDTSVGAVFNTNTFHEDVLKLNSYYDKVGYGGQLPTHVADIAIDPQSGVLTLKIQEGLTVRSVINHAAAGRRPGLIQQDHLGRDFPKSGPTVFRCCSGQGRRNAQNALREE